MKRMVALLRPGRFAMMTALVVVLAGPALPVLAQDNLAEARIRKMEAEIRALQRQVFPGGDGKYFPPEITSGTPATASTAGQAATTPVTDLLTRMDSIEAQLARLTSQSEENANRIRQLEARLGPAAGTATPTPSPTPTATSTPAANANLAAMSGGASATPTPTPTPTPSATPTPRPTPTPTATPTPKPAAASGPTAQRLAAVRAIVKPQTEDPGDDEYSYGYRLWEAKFFPEAQQQLKLMIDRYPRHTRISFARNLLGRAYLDDGKPRDAATWFLQNYQSNKRGDRAADSLVLLAESMSRLKDTSRACIALAEFAETYPAEAAGRLRSQYEATRATVKCAS